MTLLRSYFTKKTPKSQLAWKGVEKRCLKELNEQEQQMEYVLIRYGHFFQLVHPIAGGHLSVAIGPRTQPLDLLDKIRQVLVENGLENDAS